MQNSKPARASGDYNKEFALLFAAIAAAKTEAITDQADRLKRQVVPTLHRIATGASAAAKNPDTRGKLADDIADARRTVQRIMGANWKPKLDDPVARVLMAKGIDPRQVAL